MKHATDVDDRHSSGLAGFVEWEIQSSRPAPMLINNIRRQTAGNTFEMNIFSWMTSPLVTRQAFR
jgi:hypothetical protein